MLGEKFPQEPKSTGEKREKGKTGKRRR